jgi:hypothetical protein
MHLRLIRFTGKDGSLKKARQSRLGAERRKALPKKNERRGDAMLHR